MQRSSKEVAREFVTLVLRDPALAQRYQALQVAHSKEADGRGGVHRALRQLGYDTTPEDVDAALTELMSDDLSFWTGEYEVFASSQRVGRLSITSSGVSIDGKRIEKYEFHGGVLSWSPADGDDWFGNVKFSVAISKDGEPLPDGAYIGPQLRGKFWRGGAEPPVEDNVVGKVGVFSAAGGLNEFEADPPDIWIGRYDTHVLSREGSWEPGPAIVLGKCQTGVELYIDDAEVPRRVYSNGNLSWVQTAPRHSGSVTFYYNNTGGATFVEFVGRIWSGIEQSSPVLNAIGQRR
jgi:hypothetical protein